MPANKMPEMPDYLDTDLSHMSLVVLHSVVEDYGRACYLAAIAAARECVPEADDPSLYDDPHSVDLRAAAQAEVDYRDEFLANLSALEQGVGK